jgi:hypothetical protein
MKRHLISLSFAFVLLGSLVLAAHASTVVPFSQTSFVIGFETFNQGFTVPEAGEYMATIVDFETPVAFNTLLFAVTTTDPLGFIDFVEGAGGEGSFIFTGDPGVNYVANIVAKTGYWGGIGLFGAQVNLIPIPQTLLLLGSGLIGLVIVRRRR